MDQKALVTVYTQAYNTKQYIRKCIDSVLSQTYKNFEYILVDNGCTDGSSEIIQEFAEKDSRIRLIRFSENQVGPRPKITKEYAAGVYYAVIDSDDWWEPDYLERMVGFLEKNDLDLAVTGTIQYFEESGVNSVMRKLEQPILVTQEQFAQHYPNLWAFPSTNWATLQKMSIWRKGDFTGIPVFPYGGDTMQMLHYIKLCNRIGIDNSALYHYRIRPTSVTYQYNPRRFDGNIAYYEQIKEFLISHQAFDTEKSEWLKRVHLHSMEDTLKLLRDAQVPAEQKLDECLRILNHPLTNYVMTAESEERDRWFTRMWEILLIGLSKLSPSGREKLSEALSFLSPNCGKAFRPEDIDLLGREPALWEAVKAGDPKQLSDLLLKLIAEKKFSKQFDLGAILHRLIPENSVLRKIEDTRFFRTYAQDSAEILAGNHIAALDHMTELLLGNAKLYAPEQFLDVYLSLAALENHVEAFVFGKLQLAKVYLQKGKKEDCRAVTQELAEMGLENEEFSALCRELRELEGSGSQA